MQEALRIQSEPRLDEGDLWRVFCKSDPERALRGLLAEAANGNWDVAIWRSLIWAANEVGEENVQCGLARAFMEMPEASLKELLPSASSWLQKRRKDLGGEGGPGCLVVWDRLATLAYVDDKDGAAVEAGRDILIDALNAPGGVLAWVLVDALSDIDRSEGQGLPPNLAARFNLIGNARGRAGLLGRVYLTQALAYFDWLDPVWTEANLIHRLAWSHDEALPLWRACAYARQGTARLFNRLRPYVLEAFERRQLNDGEMQGLIARLLSVSVWHLCGEGLEFELSPAQMKGALVVGPPSARRNVSWNLWRRMANHEGNPGDKIIEWRTVVAPLLRSIWPLDAELRDQASSENLVRMALESGSAFPEAVDEIIDLIVPYRIYEISLSLRLESRHSGLVATYPLAFVRLVNALIDPERHPIPPDLGAFLRECVDVDASVARDPAYVRLRGLSREQGA